MGRVLSNQRKKEIQGQLEEMGLDQIIRDFVIDLSPFTVPSSSPKPTSQLEDDEKDRILGEAAV